MECGSQSIEETPVSWVQILLQQVRPIDAQWLTHACTFTMPQDNRTNYDNSIRCLILFLPLGIHGHIDIMQYITLDNRLYSRTKFYGGGEGRQF